jgi:hypothetical protein
MNDMKSKQVNRKNTGAGPQEPFPGHEDPGGAPEIRANGSA